MPDATSTPTPTLPLPRRIDSSRPQDVPAEPSPTRALRSPRQLAPWEGALALVVVTAWALVFVLGIVVDSSALREIIARDLAVGRFSLETLQAIVFVMVCYTVPNIALLCMCASVLGSVGRTARLANERDNDPRDEVSPYFSAIIRGFFIYLVVLSGLLVLDGNPLVSPDPGHYFRLAGLLSLISFVASYNPGVFSGLLSRAAGVVNPNGPARRADAPAPAPAALQSAPARPGTRRGA